MSNYRKTACPIVKEFLNYHESIKGHSQGTVDSYYSDIKAFIGWINAQERPHDEEAYMDENITLEKLGQITRMDIYEYMSWLSREKHLEAATRARRLAAVRALYRYLCVASGQLHDDPTVGVSPPKVKRRLPVYLNENQAEELLEAPEGTFALRDQTILMLFMVCGLRISELASLDLDDLNDDSIHIIGKGNKDRVVFMSDPLKEQVDKYLELRYTLTPKKGHERALFLSRLNTRISVRRIRSMVMEQFRAAGLDASKYSPHKLRHTAATLMLKNGVDIRVIQDFLGHENLGTTEIYTHVDNADLRTAAQVSPIGKSRKINETGGV